MTGNGKLRVAASYAKYVGAIQETQVSSATQAGTPLVLYWYYDGAGATPINDDPNGTLKTRAQALTQLFAWFQAQGCPNLQTCQVPLGGAQVPGVNQQIRGSLDSPNAKEYSIGVAGNLGSRASYRVDLVRREFGDFYNLQLDQSTGKVTDQFGNTFDLQIVGNTNALERSYTALQSQFRYQPFQRLAIGGSWTWSHTLGNFNGETAGSGAVRGLPDFYPEYARASWSIPRGDLAIDQRHRVRAFASWELPVPRSLGAVSLGVIQSYDTGTPYAAAGLALVSPYVTNPGYATPPRTSTYYFSSRDSFRTDNVSRTDLSVNYSFRVADAVEVFVHPQVLNVFNNQAALTVDATVLSAANAAGLSRFNPFTTPARPGRQLGLRPGLREGPERRGLPAAADVPAVRRGALLGGARGEVRSSRAGPAREERDEGLLGPVDGPEAARRDEARVASVFRHDEPHGGRRGGLGPAGRLGRQERVVERRDAEGGDRDAREEREGARARVVVVGPREAVKGRRRGRVELAEREGAARPGEVDPFRGLGEAPDEVLGLRP